MFYCVHNYIHLIQEHILICMFLDFIFDKFVYLFGYFISNMYAIYNIYNGSNVIKCNNVLYLLHLRLSFIHFLLCII